MRSPSLDRLEEQSPKATFALRHLAWLQAMPHELHGTARILAVLQTGSTSIILGWVVYSATAVLHSATTVEDPGPSQHPADER